MSEKDHAALAASKGFRKLPAIRTRKGMQRYGVLTNEYVHPEIHKLLRVHPQAYEHISPLKRGVFLFPPRNSKETLRPKANT